MNRHGTGCLPSPGGLGAAGPAWLVAVVLAVASLSLAETAPVESSSQGEEAVVRQLFGRMAAACGVVGKGTARVLVVPAQWFSPSKAQATSATTGAEPAPETVSDPSKKPWFPNTLVEGRLTSAADLSYELEQLRAFSATSMNPRPGAPSPVLLALLEASQEGADEPAAVAKSAPGKRSEERPGEVAASPQAESRGRTAAPLRRFLFGGGKAGGNVPATAGTLRSGTDSVGASDAPPGPEYVAVVFRGPFHAFDELPDQTILIELEGDRVGRVKDRGKEWAWLQLDTGLMGVMRNRYLRAATEHEVQQFLAMETSSAAGPDGNGMSMSLMDLDSRTVPVLSEPSGGAGQPARAGAEKGPEGGKMEGEPVQGRLKTSG